MKNYEITFITKEEPKDSAKNILETFGGKILKTSSMGQKTFVYPIEKEKSGFYTTYLFSMEAEKVQDFNRKLTLDEEILRHLIVVIKPSQEMDGLTKKIDTVDAKESADVIAEEIIKEPVTAIEIEPEMEIEVKPEEEIVVIEEPKEEIAPKKPFDATQDREKSIKIEPVKKAEPKVEAKIEKPKAKKTEPVEKPVKPAKPLRPEVEPVDEDERLEALDKKLEELLKD